MSDEKHWAAECGKAHADNAFLKKRIAKLETRIHQLEGFLNNHRISIKDGAPLYEPDSDKYNHDQP